MRTERTILDFRQAATNNRPFAASPLRAHDAPSPIPNGRRRTGGILRNLLSLALASCGAFSVSAFVYETPSEFSSTGDFNGDGLPDMVIVDKVTGTYRLGYQQGGGAFNWVSPRSSGVENVTGFSVGKLTSLTRDSLAFTAPEANRVNILDANDPAVAGLPASVFGPGIGPNSVIAMDIGGGGNTTHHDLNVGSQWNGASATYHTLVRNDGTTNRTVIAHQAIGGVAGGANRIVIKTNAYDRMGFFMRTTGTETFRIYDHSLGTTVQTLAIGTTLTNNYIFGRFHPTNVLSQILFYRPGDSNFLSYQVTEPVLGTFSVSGPLSFNLGQRIRQMLSVTSASTNKLLVIFGDGETATVYQYNGLTAPVPVQTFNAEPGEHFTGGGVLGGNNLSLFSGAIGSNTSSKFKVWNWNGSGYTAGASGDLPSIHALSGKANVLLFRYEPFVTTTPVLVRLLKGGDWSSALIFGGGAPPPVTVNVENFAGSAAGLDNPTATPLGPSHPLGTNGLVNQYSNFISIFSYSAPIGDEITEVKVSPGAGTYKSAVNLVFTASDVSHLIYFRFGTAGAWQQYTNQPVHVFTNVTVYYYGQLSAGNLKSKVKSAAYAFTLPPSTLDSDGDGVPDYVEVAKGLDPVNSGSDSDDDGFTDLEELVANTNPLVATNHPPTNWARLDLKASFDWAITPRPRDGVNHVSQLSSNGTPVRAYNMQASLLAYGATTNVGIPGVANPAVRLSNIVVETQERLLVGGTDLHYDIQTSAADKRIGREMVRLISVPAVQAVSVPYVFAGGSLASEASNWIASASNAYASSTREIVKNEMVVNDTLVALLVEKKLAEILQTRGSNWWSNMTLFAFRSSDAARTNPPQDTLLSLEFRTSNGLPGWQLRSIYNTISNQVFTSAFGAIVNLRAVAANIYDISSALNNTNPATYISPVDELRYFLWNGTYDSNYLAASGLSGIFASATIGANSILAAVLPRPTTNLTLITRVDSFQGYCRTFDIDGTASQANLFNEEGDPFAFPDSFHLLPGSRIQIFGYSDITNNTCAGQDIEVISTSLESVPIASDSDTDANLLIDTWERLFLDGLGSNPFGDYDLDGYQNLQEMFEGSDPSDNLGIPATGPVVFTKPVLEIIPDGAIIRLRFNWPAAYISKIRINVKTTPSLSVPFTDVGVASPGSIGANRWEVTVPTPVTPDAFFLISLSLAPL